MLFVKESKTDEGKKFMLLKKIFHRNNQILLGLTQVTQLRLG